MNAAQLYEIAKEYKPQNHIQEIKEKTPYQIDLILTVLNSEARKGNFFTYIELIPKDRKVKRGLETWGIKLENLQETKEYLENLGFKTLLHDHDYLKISWELN